MVFKPGLKPRYYSTYQLVSCCAEFQYMEKRGVHPILSLDVLSLIWRVIVGNEFHRACTVTTETQVTPCINGCMNMM
jgi:hypothetical protein